MSARYDIVFEGKLIPGMSPEEAKARLVRLFGSPTKIEALFSGGQVLVKSGVGAEDAKRYEAAFAQAGAVCALIPAAGASSGPSLSPPATRTQPYTSPPAKAGHGTLAYGSPSADADYIAPTVPPDEATSPPPAPATLVAPAPLVPAQPALVAAPVPGVAWPATSPLASAPCPVPTPAVATAAPARAIPSLEPGGVPLGAAASGPNDLDLDEESPARVPQIEMLMPGTLAGEADSLSGTLEHANLDVESPTDQYDLALPFLARDPRTGEVIAEPPACCERPGPGLHPNQRAAPYRAPAIGPSQRPGPGGAAPDPSVLAPGVAPAVVTGRPLRELESSDESEHTFGMARAVESWRFGMTVTTIAFLLTGLLASCSALGALVRMEVGAFLGGLLPAAVWVGSGIALWMAVGKLPNGPGEATTQQLTGAIEAHRRFWILWTIVNVAMGTLGIVGFGVALAVGGVRDLNLEARTAESVGVESWQKNRTPGGYTIELSCSDGVTRSVECTRAPDGSHECRCIVDGEVNDEFESRVEPLRGQRIVVWANDNCGWELESNLSRRPIANDF